MIYKENPMSRVIHFEIPAQDPGKIAAFYREVFGWEITKWEGGGQPYWLVKTGEDGTPGIDGGLFTPSGLRTGVINTIDVQDIDALLNKVKANGGQIIMEKGAIPGVGWLAYCKDVEGTIFGMMQADPAAGTAQ
jgi:predicted enzyme related to lactoylglutathione lyase